MSSPTLPLLHHCWRLCAFFCSACQPHVLLLLLPPVAWRCFFNSIQIITPCLINIAVIQFLYVCLHGSSLVVVVCCVFSCVCVCLGVSATCCFPPQSLKSVEDQTDNMKCSGMEETGNNQVLLLWKNYCFIVCGWAGYQTSVPSAIFLPKTLKGLFF